MWQTKTPNIHDGVPISICHKKVRCARFYAANHSLSHRHRQLPAIKSCIYTTVIYSPMMMILTQPPSRYARRYARSIIINTRKFSVRAHNIRVWRTNTLHCAVLCGPDRATVCRRRVCASSVCCRLFALHEAFCTERARARDSDGAVATAPTPRMRPEN